MRVFAVTIATLAAFGLSAGVAQSCSHPGDSQAFQRAEEQRYLERVTTIYTGVLEDLVGRQDDPVVTFNLRKTGDVWGYPGATRLGLKFYNGSCQNYLPFLLDGPGSARNGLPVTIFVTPASRADPAKLYILPTGRFSDDMMVRWRETLPRRFGH